jgi:outer membrane protein OmpA-like peptidoglycan-associated protein
VAAGQLAFDAQIAMVQSHPAFMHLGFTNEELAAGLRELGPKNAQNIYDVIYPDAAAKVKQVYYDAWERNMGTTRQVMDFVQGLVDDGASRGRREGEKEAMKALMGIGKPEAAPLLKEKDKAAVIPVKRVRAWRYTLANFQTGLSVPNVAEYFQVLNGIRQDLGVHKAHLETLKPAMEQAGIPLQDFTVTFWIVGYASRLGGQGSNQELAEKRAASVSGLLQGSLGGAYQYNASGKGAAVPKESTTAADIDDPRPEADPAKLEEIKKQKLEEYRQQFPNISEAERQKMVEERYGAASNEETMRRVDIFMNWEGYEMP